MEVVVEDKQLSLAIGKKGQNVRLAAKLTGWRIDIKSEEEQRREVEAQFEGLGGATEEPAAGTDGPAAELAETPDGDGAGDPPAYALAGIGDKTVRKLIEAGLGTIEAVAAATVAQLQDIPGIGEKTAEKIVAAARGDGGTAPVDATVDTEERS
jgi:N utilization substance protein A